MCFPMKFRHLKFGKVVGDNGNNNAGRYFRSKLAIEISNNDYQQALIMI